MPVVGLCGGYQIMGERVADPAGIEASGDCAGLGLIHVVTALAAAKTTRRVRAAVVDPHGPVRPPAAATLDGYEIHHGRSRIGAAARAWLAVEGEPIGAWAPEAASTWGAYLHGIFHKDTLRDGWLTSLRTAPAGRFWEAQVEREIDPVADIVERSLDMAWLNRVVEDDACRI